MAAVVSAGVTIRIPGGPAPFNLGVAMDYVSPGVFSLGIEAGIDLVSVFHEVAQDTFDFAVPAGSEITEVAQLEGKTVALGDAGWSSITDPMFAQAGVEGA